MKKNINTANVSYKEEKSIKEVKVYLVFSEETLKQMVFFIQNTLECDMHWKNDFNKKFNACLLHLTKCSDTGACYNICSGSNRWGCQATIPLYSVYRERLW